MAKIHDISELLDSTDTEDNVENDLNPTRNLFFSNLDLNQQPSSIPISSSVVFNDTLDEKICSFLISEIEENKDTFGTALTGNFDSPNDYMLNKIRKSEVYFLPPTHWVTGIVWNYVKLANDENWQYDITAIQSVQITKYNEGGFYNWHTDFCPDKCSPNYYRKLSITIQLNDPSEYEGGILQIFDYQNKRIDIEKRKGSICVFEGRTLHRVTKIKSGSRYSLVAWINGPPLK